MTQLERLTPQRRRELTREALLEAASTVFAERGFDGASVDDVAEAAGFSKGAVYSNFASKADLFFSMVQRRDEQRLRAMAGVVDEIQGAGLDATLERVAETLASDLNQDREWVLLNVEVWLYAQRNEDARRHFLNYQRRHQANIVRFVREAAKSAGFELRLQAEDLAPLLTAASSGIAQLNLSDPDAGYNRLYGQLLSLLTGIAVSGP